MGLKIFFKNLRYLFKYNIKEINRKLDTLACLHNKDYLNNFIEQILYETSSDKIKRPKLKNHDETVELLINSNSSLARLGDGEIQIIEGRSIAFQEYNKELAEKLEKVLKTNNENLLIGINYEYYYPEIDKMNDEVAHFYRYDVPAIRKKLNSYIDYNKQYVTAGFTQLYMSFKEYDFEKHYKNLKQIWNNKKILLVLCKEALKDITYNIFDNASEINYLYIPSKHAFRKYDDICKDIKKYSTDTLIIPMAGPTAKVLALDLIQEGYRILDLGHLMKDYDWYKKSISRTNDNIIKFMSPD